MTYFRRNIDIQLERWRDSSEHKPLLIRGARQVGKSTAVQQLGKTFPHFLEVNFEKRPELQTFFPENVDVRHTCQMLSVTTGVPIIPGQTLLFIDEIQSCPAAIRALRYFWEDYPELHVIAAGSLLEFALEELPSFAVGRLRSFYLYPFSFDDFLCAQGLDNLVAFKQESVKKGEPLPEPIHRQLQQQLRTFYIVGGMPYAVHTWVTTHDLLQSKRVHNDILDTYQQDFSKYRRRVPPALLRQVLRSVCMQAGNKFVYAQASREQTAIVIKDCLHLLTLAGLITPVTHTAAQGLPLGAQANSKYTKYLFLDLGLMQTLLDLPAEQLLIASDIDFVNRGAASELFAGLELLKSADSFVHPELYYWQNTAKGTQGEIDYLTTLRGNIIPIEVKAGTQGSMQSLYAFMRSRQSAYGIRTSMENVSHFEHDGLHIRIIPLYALSALN